MARLLLSLFFVFITTASAIIVPIALPSYHSIDSDPLAPDPKGITKKIGGIDTYVAVPPRGTPWNRQEAVLFLTDIFGLASDDNKRVADEFARSGYLVVAPDYLNGDPVTPEEYADPNFDSEGWLALHGQEQTFPSLYSVMEALKKEGVKRFAATGYCFGGLYTLLLAQRNQIKVGTTAHPSLWNIPDDLFILRNQSVVPLQVHTAEHDIYFPAALAEKVDDVLKGEGDYSALDPYKPGYERFHYLGVSHGFATHLANASDPVQVAAKEAARQRALEWIRKYL